MRTSGCSIGVKENYSNSWKKSFLSSCDAITEDVKYEKRLQHLSTQILTHAVCVLRNFIKKSRLASLVPGFMFNNTHAVLHLMLREKAEHSLPRNDLV